MNYFLLVILPNIGTASAIIGTLGLIGLIIISIILVIAHHAGAIPFTRKDRKFLRCGYSFMGFLILIACLTPSDEQLKKVLILDAVSNIKNIDELPNNTVELINEFLKKETAKLKERT